MGLEGDIQAAMLEVMEVMVAMEVMADVEVEVMEEGAVVEMEEAAEEEMAEVVAGVEEDVEAVAVEDVEAEVDAVEEEVVIERTNHIDDVCLHFF